MLKSMCCRSLYRTQAQKLNNSTNLRLQPGSAQPTKSMVAKLLNWSQWILSNSYATLPHISHMTVWQWMNLESACMYLNTHVFYVRKCCYWLDNFIRWKTLVEHCWFKAVGFLSMWYFSSLLQNQYWSASYFFKRCCELRCEVIGLEFIINSVVSCCDTLTEWWSYLQLDDHLTIHLFDNYEFTMAIQRKCFFIITAPAVKLVVSVCDLIYLLKPSCVFLKRAETLRMSFYKWFSAGCEKICTFMSIVLCWSASIFYDSAMLLQCCVRLILMSIGLVSAGRDECTWHSGVLKNW